MPGGYRTTQINYLNSQSFQEDMIDLYNQVFKDIEDSTILETQEAYTKHDTESFKQYINSLRPEEVKTFYTRLQTVKEKNRHADLDEYLDQTHPEIIAEVSRELLSSDALERQRKSKEGTI